MDKLIDMACSALGAEGGGSGSEADGQVHDKYPLHWSIWNNDLKTLKKLVEKEKEREKTMVEKRALEEKDPRGRTPLMLAVSLGHFECVRFLLSQNANVNVEDRNGFNVLHEAVSTGDPELVQEVLERRDKQRYYSRVDGIPVLLRKIRDTPDFYVEMKWEFTSWVPLVSRMCPSDTYKIYKSGSSVRIDTTLLGFDQTNWQRGSRSYIFKGNEEGAVFMEVDHDLKQVQLETMRVLSPDMAETVNMLKPSAEMVQSRLTTPTTITYLDTDKISFERSKAGIIGFRSDRSENVNGHDCRVFTANSVEVVTKSRTEHMSHEDKAQHKAATASRLTPFQSLLGMVETEDKAPSESNSPSGSPKRNIHNLQNITPENYFDPTVDLGTNDIGRPRDTTTKTQRFKAHLWLSEEYPLSLQEQVLPIVDLMAISSSHFAKLRDFITLQLPAGFPVKIEIPLFHVLNARITFGNIFSLDAAVTGVTPIRDDAATACVVEDNCFEPPAGYRVLGSEEMRQWSGDDDEHVQAAIQQYLMEDGTDADQVTIWEALGAQQAPDADLQRAIQESLAEYHRSHPGSNLDHRPRDSPEDPTLGTTLEPSEAQSNGAQTTIANGHIPGERHATAQTQAIAGWSEELDMALRLSQQEKEEEDKRRREEEQILELVLKMSMTEK